MCAGSSVEGWGWKPAFSEIFWWFYLQGRCSGGASLKHTSLSSAAISSRFDGHTKDNLSTSLFRTQIDRYRSTRIVYTKYRVYCGALDASPLYTRGRVLDAAIQPAPTTAKETLDKSLVHNVCSCRTRMCMVVGKQGIHLGLSHRLENVGRILAMIHEYGPRRTNLARYILGVVSKATGSIAETATLPWIVRCRTGDEDLGALGRDSFGRVEQVRRICQHCDRLSVVSAFTRFIACAGTVCAAVVCGQGATVVVAKFDNHNVVRFDRLDDVVEAAFHGEGACATATNSFVYHGNAERVLEKFTPA
jgi:hypothetical protein